MPLHLQLPPASPFSLCLWPHPPTFPAKIARSAHQSYNNKEVQKVTAKVTAKACPTTAIPLCTAAAATNNASRKDGESRDLLTTSPPVELCTILSDGYGHTSEQSSDGYRSPICHPSSVVSRTLMATGQVWRWPYYGRRSVWCLQYV
jgi:hypothetical protein